MLKIKYFLLVIAFVFVSLQVFSKDIEFKTLNNCYRLQNSFRIIAFSAYWSIKSNKFIPPDKFLKLTISYTLDDKNDAVSFILNPKMEFMKIDDISVFITRLEGFPGTLFIRAGSRFSGKFWIYEKKLSEKSLLKGANLNFVQNISFDLNDEVVLGKTHEDDPGKTVVKVKKISQPSFIMKAKVEVVDTPVMFLLPKDLRPILAKLTMLQQYDWINKELKRREDLYRRSHATLNDLRLAITYLCIIRDKMKAAGIKIPDQKPKKLQRTRPLKVQSIKLQSIN